MEYDFVRAFFEELQFENPYDKIQNYVIVIAYIFDDILVSYNKIIFMTRLNTEVLTTHVGSLPRSKAVTDLVFAKEQSQPVNEEQFQQVIAQAVDEVVAKQVASGIDIVSDGEMSKISYATYIKDRLTGFQGDSPRVPPKDLEDFPKFLEKQAKSGGTPTYSKPCCVAEIQVKDSEPLQKDLSHFQSAVQKHQPKSAFMNAASPGVIALFLPNQYYSNQEQYLEALAETMREEYEAITHAGFILQLDCPDIGLGRHMMFKNESEETYIKLVEQHIEVLNHSLRNIPSEKIRFHICFGNYEGPHHHDISMQTMLPLAMKVNAKFFLFENANPRHGHEWKVFQENKIPEDKVLVPGVIDSTTNFIEHPELVAQRLQNFIDAVGKERVIAGTDCGFSTFAGFGKVDEDIVYAKFKALKQGAEIASKL